MKYNLEIVVLLSSLGMKPMKNLGVILFLVAIVYILYCLIQAISLTPSLENFTFIGWIFVGVIVMMIGLCLVVLT